MGRGSGFRTDADVSSIPPISPYGEISPVGAGRLAFQAVPSWVISGSSLLRRSLCPPSSLHPPFVHLLLA